MLNRFFHDVEDFVSLDLLPLQEKVSYWYEGKCSKTGKYLKLPRSILVEKIAYKLMEYLNQNEFFRDEGKMYGVLLSQNPQGKLKVIKAFSGLFLGEDNIEGWVNQIPGRNKFALAQKFTLQELDKIKQKIIDLERLSIREEYQTILIKYEQDLSSLKKKHRQRKKIRDDKRNFLQENRSEQSIQKVLANLEQESRKDDWERRVLKKEWQEILFPLENQVKLADKQIQALKKERKILSRQLQSQMQGAYSLTNFLGQTLSLSELVDKSFIPTGTGDCCAPKLLHYSAVNKLKPLAMAEFWWGKSSPNGEKMAGNFYPACVERCQPIMGFLLSGLGDSFQIKEDYQIPIIYEDNYLLVIDKPSGLLSVPGRKIDNFDSAESRFKNSGKGNQNLKAVHRLDQDTSGLLILAKDTNTYVCLSQQFAQKRVIKLYEAVLAGFVDKVEGEIDLPLWSNPENRPIQEVCFSRGKASMTRYRVIGFDGDYTRVEFLPITGRTHQLRVHSVEGLGIPIKGDRIYGFINNNSDRLHLHAREISFYHPITNEKISLKSPCPF